MKKVVQVKGLLPVSPKRIDIDEQSVCEVYKFNAFRVVPSKRNIDAGVEFVLRSSLGEQIIVCCFLAERWLIRKVKWYSEPEVDAEMSDYLVKAFIDKYLTRFYHLELE